MGRLLNRLTTIADMVIKGKPVADIGADHALLSIYMLEEKLIPSVIVTDINNGPYVRAKKAVANSLYRDSIEIRKGDGIDIINPHEVSTVIIAGLGGDTIADIIARDWDKAESFECFVLQPMSRPYVVRNLLSMRGWRLNDERIVYENEKFFVILSYFPDNEPYELDLLETEIGPILLKEPFEHKKAYLGTFLTQYKNMRNSLQESSGEKVQATLRILADKINRLEEILDVID
ncbi:MAG TPA: class I SAM-dependent methyltransferase [Syntrophomonadaceae bacterium]|nr:class I SAM-dependent methyltransferase [Syntrophomonadaceae bacterium]